MKKIFKYILTVTVLFQSFEIFSQSIAINTSGTAAATGAGLDVDFSDKGILIPRVSLANSTDLMGNASLPISLIIYKKDVVGWASAIGYYYWDGTQWVSLAGGSGWGTSGNTLTEHCLQLRTSG